jgi:hypothetical protein
MGVGGMEYRAYSQKEWDILVLTLTNFTNHESRTRDTELEG